MCCDVQQRVDNFDTLLLILLYSSLILHLHCLIFVTLFQIYKTFKTNCCKLHYSMNEFMVHKYCLLDKKGMPVELISHVSF